MIRKLIVRKNIIFLSIVLLVMFFSLTSFAQQAQPTQPLVVVVHPKPDPDFSVCSAQFDICADAPTGPNTLSDYCGPDFEYFSAYGAGQAACGDISISK